MAVTRSFFRSGDFFSPEVYGLRGLAIAWGLQIAFCRAFAPAFAERSIVSAAFCSTHITWSLSPCHSNQSESSLYVFLAIAVRSRHRWVAICPARRENRNHHGQSRNGVFVRLNLHQIFGFDLKTTLSLVKRLFGGRGTGPRRDDPIFGREG